MELKTVGGFALLKGLNATWPLLRTFHLSGLCLLACSLNSGHANASVNVWHAYLPGSGIERYIGPPPADKAAFDVVCDEYWSGSGITDHDNWYGPDGPGNHSLCISPTGYGNKWMLSRPTGVTCSSDQNIDPLTGACGCGAGKVLKRGQCVIPPADCEIGNPCDPASGNKSQTEVDFGSNAMGVEVVRVYNSSEVEDVGFGVGWTSTFHKRLVVDSNNVIAVRENGRGDPWTKAGGLWSSDADSPYLLSEHANGYTLTLKSGERELYDFFGRIQSETRLSGRETQYAYDAGGRLVSVTGPFGHAFHLTYNGSGRVASVTDPGGRTYLYGYDDNGNLERVEYPDSGLRLYHYEDADLLNHLTGITDENGDRYATYAYDRSGRTVSSEHSVTENGVPQERYSFDYSEASTTVVTDPAGQLWDYGYEQNLGISKLVHRRSRMDGIGVTREFDDNNNVVSYRDEQGNMTLYTYNHANQRISTVEAAGTTEVRTTTTEYLSDALDLPVRATAPSVRSGGFREALTSYDGDLNVAAAGIRGFDPDGVPVMRTTTYGYNTLGQVTSVDGPRADVSDIYTMTYYECNSGGECGQLSSVTNEIGHTTTFDSYNAAGLLTRSTDPLGVVTERTYDARNRIVGISQIPPNGEPARSTSFTYDKAGQLIMQTNPDGAVFTFVYDPAHNLRSIEDSLGNRTEYAHDSKGNVIQVSSKDADGMLARSTRTTYDLRDRVESIDRGGSITQTRHDGGGNLLSVTDPNHNPATIHRYDVLNRIVETFDRLSNPVKYKYDAQDNLIEVIAANGAVTSYEYDDLGNLLEETSPDRGATSYSYDSAGNVISIIDARGIAATYVYDALNRVMQIDYPGADQDRSFVYDDCENGAGRLCKVVKQTGTTSYQYDYFGNVVTHIRDDNGSVYTTRYRYDAADRIIKISYPQGGTVSYQRDMIGRITDVKFEIDGVGIPILNNRLYRADGLATSNVLGNGLLDVRQYDTQGQLVAQGLGTIDSRSYQFDANGNILNRDQRTGESSDYLGASFVYDALDRVVAEAGPQGRFEFTYDANGNRTSKFKNDAMRYYEFGAATNRLSKANGKEVILDAAGNVLEDRKGKRAFIYDPMGRLSQAYKDGVLKATYVYNAYGLRTRKIKESLNGQKTFDYYYDLNGNLLAEARNGIVLRYYIWVDTQPLAQLRLKQDDTGAISTKHVTYLTTDHLETPRLGTDDSQNIVWRWEGDAFGQSKADKDPDSNGNNRNVRLRFPGQLYDAETGLHYNWFRYYDPKTGRYLSSDPIGLRGGLNTYAYVNLNPVRWFDRLGLESPIDNWPPMGVPSQPLPGYNYCGPGQLPRIPSNGLDDACRMHDECYSKCGLSARSVSILNPGQCNQPGCQDECDDALCDAAGIHQGWVRAGVRYLFCD